MSVDRERIEQDARAGVMWGEDSRTVRMLRANGLDDGEAAAVMAVLRRERAASAFGNGSWEVV